MMRNGVYRLLIAAASVVFSPQTAAAAWGPEQNIIPPAQAYGGSWTASNNARSLAVSGDTLFLVWTDTRIGPEFNTGNQVLFKFYDGTTWGGDTIIGYIGNWRRHNWYPSCVLDGAGRLHIVWESNEHGYYEDPFRLDYDLSYASYYQGGWSSQQHLVAGPSNAWHPVIAATTDGKVYVCWQDDRSGGFRLYYKVLDQTGWSGDIAVPGSAVYASFPSLASSGNAIAVAWQDFRTGAFQIHLKEFSLSGWGPDSALSHSSQGAYAPCLVSDAAGNYHVAWEDWRDNNAEIYYRRYDRASLTWGPEIRITADPWRSRAPVLVCRGDTLVDVFWEDDRGGYYEIFSRQARRGGSEVWSPETTLTSGWAHSCCPAAAADSRGNLYLVWSDFNVNSASARPSLFFMSDIISPWPKSEPANYDAMPAAAALLVRAFPNPARGQATIAFTPAAGDGANCEVKIYSITGQRLKTLRPRLPQGGGGSATWDGTDDRGRKVASGVYLVTLSQGGRSGMTKIMLIR
ncbi:MAG: FlgD immunoglobulin-like domain containing protein [Candidatus Edwardsbacteria bacterium]|nr:FlgD immunoglobulin-like domain containing protein [Candidatus Edwardsbacteria bacterium]